jgi:hypothetical protein
MIPNEQLEALRLSWKPPRELSRALPRDVQLSVGGMLLMGLAFLLFLGAVFAYRAIQSAAARQAQRQAMLEQRGVDTEAVITRLWRRRDKERQPMVTYRFEHEGRVYEGSSSVSLRAWREMKEGEPLAVRYVASDPGVNQPRDRKASGTPSWLPLLVALSLAGTGAFLVYFLGRQKRLLSEGRPAPAIVTRYTSGQHGSKYAHYEFAAGRAVAKGATGVARGSPKIGDTLCVVYDPEKPRRNARYPMDLVKLR